MSRDTDIGHVTRHLIPMTRTSSRDLPFESRDMDIGHVTRRLNHGIWPTDSASVRFAILLDHVMSYDVVIWES